MLQRFGLPRMIRTARPPAPGAHNRWPAAGVPLVTGGLVLALLSGCGGPGGPGPAPTSAGAGAAASAQPLPAPTALVDVPRSSTDLASQLGPVSAPVRLQVGALGIDMPIESVGVADDSALALPANPAVAAWYRYGSGPDSASGATVVAAHVDSLVYDLGPFAELAHAPAGTEIVLSTADGGSHRYTVAAIDTVLKTSVSWASVFDRSGDPRLTMVTCGGEFDYEAKHYLSNVIVTAVPEP